MNARVIGGWRCIFTGIFLLLLSAGGLTSGCQRTQMSWIAEAQSPDGNMVATARAFANGGFGVSGAPATVVYLNWTTGSQEPTEILILQNQSDRVDEVQVGMKWLAPNRLELSLLGKHQQIQFQAIKFHGVDISVRDASISGA